MKVILKTIISCALICALVAVLSGCSGKSEAEKNWEHGDIMTYEQYVKLNNLSVELTPQIVEIMELAMSNTQGLDTDVYNELQTAGQMVYALNDSLEDLDTFKNADIDGMIKTYESMAKDLPELKKKVSEQ